MTNQSSKPSRSPQGHTSMSRTASGSEPSSLDFVWPSISNSSPPIERTHSVDSYIVGTAGAQARLTGMYPYIGSSSPSQLLCWEQHDPEGTFMPEDHSTEKSYQASTSRCMEKPSYFTTAEEDQSSFQAPACTASTTSGSQEEQNSLPSFYASETTTACLRCKKRNERNEVKLVCGECERSERILSDALCKDPSLSEGHGGPGDVQGSCGKTVGLSTLTPTTENKPGSVCKRCAQMKQACDRFRPCFRCKALKVGCYSPAAVDKDIPHYLGLEKPRIRKARTGCLLCKKRKQRCDEVKPDCSDCTRLGFKCQWP